MRYVKESCSETASRMMVARGWEGSNGELVFSGYRVSVGKDEHVLDVNGGDGCTSMYKTAHLKVVKMVNFMLCIFHNKQGYI